MLVARAASESGVAKTFRGLFLPLPAQCELRLKGCGALVYLAKDFRRQHVERVESAFRVGTQQGIGDDLNCQPRNEILNGADR